MKTALLIAILLSWIDVSATPYWTSPNPNFTVYTNVPVLWSTNVSGATNAISATFTNSQETYQTVNNTLQVFYTAAGTNSSTIYVDKTIDGVNFVPYQTNTFTATGKYEISLFGEWQSLRIRSAIFGTNVTEQVNFIGK